jgi:tetratricopeptide (TPR) repeat protein
MKDNRPNDRSFNRYRPATLVALLALGAMLSVCVYLARTPRYSEPPPYPGKFEHGYGGDESITLATRQAHHSLMQRDYTAAQPIFEEALERFPEHMENRLGLIICLWAAHQEEQALQQVDVANDYFNSFTPADQKYAARDMVSILELRSLHNIGIGNLEAAESDAERMKQLDPENYRAYKILAMVAEKRNDLDAMGQYAAEAVKKINPVIERDRGVTEMLERANARKNSEPGKQSADKD